MPILLAVSPFAAMRSAPVITTSTSPAAIRERGRAVDDDRVRDAERLELERGQARSLEQRPCLVHPHVSYTPRSAAARIAPTADP